MREQTDRRGERECIQRLGGKGKGSRGRRCDMGREGWQERLGACVVVLGRRPGSSRLAYDPETFSVYESRQERERKGERERVVKWVAETSCEALARSVSLALVRVRRSQVTKAAHSRPKGALNVGVFREVGIRRRETSSGEKPVGYWPPPPP